jgi:hypothetical protein
MYSRLEEGKLSGDSLIVDDEGQYTDAGIK